MTVQQKDELMRGKKLLLSVGMLSVAASIFGGMFYLQQQAQSAASPPLPATREEAIEQYATKRGMVYDRKNHRMHFPDLTPDEQAVFIAKLKEFREKLRPWAQRNQSTLQTMLRAQSNDEQTLMSTYNALPGLGEESGITAKDLQPIQDGETPNRRMMGFSWQLAGRGAIIPERLRALHAKSQVSIAKRLRTDFIALRDIRLSRSVSHSEPLFSLWASGRITKSKRLHRLRTEVRNGRTVRISDSPEGPQEEIVPPYDFLKP